jgi:hypothetical protein
MGAIRKFAEYFHRSPDVRQGKGRKDRDIPLSDTPLAQLRS